MCSAATINQHKAHQKNKPVNEGYKSSYAPYPQPRRHNPYVNPNYKAANKYIRPGLNVAGPSKPASTTTTIPNATIKTPTPTIPPVSSSPVSSTGGQTKEVVLGGVAFESSSRSLVRKDCKCVFNWFLYISLRIHAFSVPKPSKPVSTGKPPPSTRSQHLHHFSRKTGHVPPARAYKQKSRRGRNMTLNNTRRPYSCVVICLTCCVLMILLYLADPHGNRRNGSTNTWISLVHGSRQQVCIVSL